MTYRIGLFGLGLAMIVATSAAEIVEEERFDLIVPAEVVEEERFDLVATEASMLSSENPPFHLIASESESIDFHPSALPRDLVLGDTGSGLRVEETLNLPFPEDDPRGTEQQDLQAP